MTTNLKISSDSDFDSLFQTGSGDQLLNIYASDGQDIGQKYLNVSQGQSYGATNYMINDNSDVGNKLCKIGTNFNYYGWGSCNSGSVKLYFHHNGSTNITVSGRIVVDLYGDSYTETVDKSVGINVNKSCPKGTTQIGSTTFSTSYYTYGGTRGSVSFIYNGKSYSCRI